MSHAPPPPAQLLPALHAFRDATAGLALMLQTPGVEAAREVRDQLVAQLDDYLIPRLTEQEAPLLVVIGGSTGAGKSTLVNTLVRQQVSRAGVLRPTTSAPVLVTRRPTSSGSAATGSCPAWSASPGATPGASADDSGRALRLGQHRRGVGGAGVARRARHRLRRRQRTGSWPSSCWRRPTCGCS